MKKISFVLSIVCLLSCSKKQHDLTVKVSIIDLKKGTVYLQKAQDTSFITVDSLVISGTSEFELYSDLESPEVFFLQLDKNNDDESNIVFFADKGITEINTTLKNFVIDAKINGSEQQKTLEEYLRVMTRFNDRNLELIKENYEAQKEQDTAKMNANRKAFDNLVKSKYLYTVNFAVTNNDSEVSPYLALTEIYDANIKWLDTINKSLTPRIKDSKYGKGLDLFIKKRQEE